MAVNDQEERVSPILKIRHSLEELNREELLDYAARTSAIVLTSDQREAGEKLLTTFSLSA